ncbi:MAG: hypothetical protein CR985_03695 [Flavobacteriales bacterium]|nr:MAG: hypothetical protein CR985_03695 [Flavobacteriales bacterium]
MLKLIHKYFIEQKKVIFSTLFLSILLITCAKRSQPTGGEKDEQPPVLLKAIPAEETTNFKADEITLTFDEFIKLKDLNKQLIISPPLKNKPLITPVGTASKKLQISILDTLKENTTYVFNFGQSVMDNNEENIYPNFKYVFSTGDIIDSLKINGKVKDAFKKEPEEYITVMLYPYDEQFTDSTIYKQQPTYVANTLDSIAWEITNIKAGKYKLIAIKDKANNFIFKPLSDQIGFIKEPVELPASQSFTLNMFKEEAMFTVIRPFEVAKNHIQIGYLGNSDNVEITALNQPDDFKSYISKEQDKDTLNYFYTGAISDSLQLKISKAQITDTVMVKLRKKELDSLKFSSSVSRFLTPNDTLKIIGNTPLTNIDTSGIKLMDKDTLPVKFKATISKDNRWISIDFDKKYNQNYKLTVMPNAITNFMQEANDTLQYKFSVKSPEDYGKLSVNFKGVKKYPIIIQLLNEKDKITTQQTGREEVTHKFIFIEPGKYWLRIIFDENNNGKWDTGSYLHQRQPEKVQYIKISKPIKANWEISETYILSRE